MLTTHLTEVIMKKYLLALMLFTTTSVFAGSIETFVSISEFTKMKGNNYCIQEQYAEALRNYVPNVNVQNQKCSIIYGSVIPGIPSIGYGKQFAQLGGLGFETVNGKTVFYYSDYTEVRLYASKLLRIAKHI